jgi:methyl-accepting chemotaxis protein
MSGFGFFNIGRLFVSNTTNHYTNVLKLFQERIKRMDARINALQQEVERTSEVQKMAIDTITKSIEQINTITQQLIEKTNESESSIVDYAAIEELVAKLKVTNDSLVNTLSVETK